MLLKFRPKIYKYRYFILYEQIDQANGGAYLEKMWEPREPFPQKTSSSPIFHRHRRFFIVIHGFHHRHITSLLQTLKLRLQTL